MGISYKLASYDNLEWYADASIQPTFIISGKSYLLSSDFKNYIKEPQALRQWNINTGVGTYINYKMEGISLQVGPQFRYQLQSSYKKEFTTNEKLYNIGIKLGVIKGF